jgi:hypothetical protein
MIMMMMMMMTTTMIMMWTSTGLRKVLDIILLDQRKHAKFQWSQNPSHTNGDNVNNVRRDTSRTFRNKNREYLKETNSGLEIKSKNKNIRDLYRVINEFKKGYQRRTNLVKNKDCDLLQDYRNNFNRCKNYFCELLNIYIYIINDVTQR